MLHITSAVKRRRQATSKGYWKVLSQATALYYSQPMYAYLLYSGMAMTRIKQKQVKEGSWAAVEAISEDRQSHLYCRRLADSVQEMTPK